MTPDERGERSAIVKYQEGLDGTNENELTHMYGIYLLTYAQIPCIKLIDK